MGRRGRRMTREPEDLPRIAAVQGRTGNREKVCGCHPSANS